MNNLPNSQKYPLRENFENLKEGSSKPTRKVFDYCKKFN